MEKDERAILERKPLCERKQTEHYKDGWQMQSFQ